MYVSFITDKKILDDFSCLYYEFHGLPNTVAERTELITLTIYIILLINRKHKEKNFTLASLCLKDALMQMEDALARLQVTHETLADKAGLVIHDKTKELQKAIQSIIRGEGYFTSDSKPTIPVLEIYSLVGSVVKFNWKELLYNNFMNPSKINKGLFASSVLASLTASAFLFGAKIALFGLSFVATGGLIAAAGILLGLICLAISKSTDALKVKQLEHITKVITGVNKHAYQLSSGLAKQLVIDNKTLNNKVLLMATQMRKDADFIGIVPNLHHISRGTSVESSLMRWLPQNNSGSPSPESANSLDESHVSDYKPNK